MEQTKIFLSSARQDLDTANKLQKALEARGHTVWRDQDSIYGGQNWPKAIGEALAAHDVLLLIWSKSASQAHFVEFEWSTALALRKPLVPCLVDEIPLPNSLSSYNWLPLNDSESALQAIIKSLRVPVKESSPSESSAVIKKLERMTSIEPQQAAQEMRNMIQQHASNVEGPVYQAGRDVIIKQEPVEMESKLRLDKWIKMVGLVAAVIGIVIGLFTLFERIESKVESIYLRGIVKDSYGEPVDAAIITVDKAPGDTVFTTSSGGFYFKSIQGKAGDRVRIYVKKDGYKQHNEYVALPGPVDFQLNRENEKDE